MPKTTKRSGAASKISIVPAAVAVQKKPSKPRVNGRRGEIVTVARRELVGSFSNGAIIGFHVDEISSSTPGLDLSITCGTLFPWGSQVGFVFEKYRFNRVKLEMVSGQPSTAAGRVYLAFDPDYSDPVPATKTRLMGLGNSVDASVWQPFSLTIPPSVMNKGMEWRFCSPSSRSAEVEPRTAYAGFFTLAYDCPTPNCVWDLWVDYEVDLMTPTSENIEPVTIQVDDSGITLPVGSSSTRVFYPTLPMQTQPPLQITTPVQAGIPAILNGMEIPNSVIQLPQTVGGALDLRFLYKKTGFAPSDILADNPQIDSYVYNDKGSFLGKLSEISGRVQNVGPLSGLDINTPGKEVLANAFWTLQQIRAAFLAARYLVPFLRIKQLANVVSPDLLRTTLTMTN